MATLAGVDLGVAKRGLVNLANLVGGDLEVSKDGETLEIIKRSGAFKSILRRLDA